MGNTLVSYGHTCKDCLSLQWSESDRHSSLLPIGVNDTKKALKKWSLVNKKWRNDSSFEST